MYETSLGGASTSGVNNRPQSQPPLSLSLSKSSTLTANQPKPRQHASETPITSPKQCAIQRAESTWQSYFPHYKVKRQLQPLPPQRLLSSLAPRRLAPPTVTNSTANLGKVRRWNRDKPLLSPGNISI